VETYSLLGGSTPPCPYYDEIDLTQTSGTLPGTTWRAAHNFNSGWSWNFEVQNAITLESYTGKYAVWVTDGEGQFGSTSGTTSCNVGGPDWQRSDNTDFTAYSGSGPGIFSNYIMPQNGGNRGNFIYQVQSCSGTLARLAQRNQPFRKAHRRPSPKHLPGTLPGQYQQRIELPLRHSYCKTLRQLGELSCLGTSASAAYLAGFQWHGRSRALPRLPENEPNQRFPTARTP